MSTRGPEAKGSRSRALSRRGEALTHAPSFRLHVLGPLPTEYRVQRADRGDACEGHLGTSRLACAEARAPTTGPLPPFALILGAASCEEAELCGPSLGCL